MKIVRLKNKKIIRKIVWAGFFVAVGFGLHMYLTPDYAAMQTPHVTPFVSVKALSKRDVSLKKKFIAEVEAINSVDIVPQISGYLEQILFKDGAFVHAGDTLFIIEQEKFKAAVQAAEANVEKAKSDLIQIENDYHRQEKLYKEKFTSKATLEVAENKFNQAKAAIKQAEADLELAQINLGYTEIKAPIDGYIGKALVSVGNYVNPSIQSLARIVQTDPIRIGFSVSDKERMTFLDEVKKINNPTRFELVLPNGEIQPISIENMFSDNEINPDTATIPVYVDYKNPDKKLIPGNYVDILVGFGAEQDALVVPLIALAQDINGSYVMTVNDDNTVEQKYLELGRVIDDVQEVKSGLSETDKVIVQGLQKVQAGSVVSPIVVKE